MSDAMPLWRQDAAKGLWAELDALLEARTDAEDATAAVPDLARTLCCKLCEGRWFGRKPPGSKYVCDSKPVDALLWASSSSSRWNIKASCSSWSTLGCRWLVLALVWVLLVADPCPVRSELE